LRNSTNFGFCSRTASSSPVIFMNQLVALSLTITTRMTGLVFFIDEGIALTISKSIALSFAHTDWFRHRGEVSLRDRRQLHLLPPKFTMSSLPAATPAGK
jgi:hypothetical protein